MHQLIYCAILSLTIFLYIVSSVAALSHFLIMTPCFYFLYKAWQERSLRPSLSQLSIAAFVLFAIVSIVASPDMDYKFKAFLKLKYFIIGAVSVYAYRELISSYLTEKRLKILVNIGIISVSIASFSGISGVLFGFNPIRFYDIPHITRSSGAYGNIMTYGYSIQFIVILLIGSLIYYKDIKKYVNRNLLLIAFVINLTGLFYSGCRGAILGFICALPFLIYKKNTKVFVISAVATAVLVALFTFITFSGGKTWSKYGTRLIQGIESRSNAIRISQYRAATYAFLENPATGIGYRNFESNSVRIKEKYNLKYKSFKGHAHSNFFEALATTGLGGLISLILFHIFWFHETWRRSDFVGNVFPPIIIALFVSGQFETTLSDGEIMYLLMMLYSISVATRKRLT